MNAEPQSIDATTLTHALDQEPFAVGLVDLSPTRPILVTQLFNREMASATKLTLGRIFPESHEVLVIRSAGLPEQTIDRIPLHRLDRVDVDHLTSVWIPASAFQHEDVFVTAPNRRPLARSRWLSMGSRANR